MYREGERRGERGELFLAAVQPLKNFTMSLQVDRPRRSMPDDEKGGENS